MKTPRNQAELALQLYLSKQRQREPAIKYVREELNGGESKAFKQQIGVEYRRLFAALSEYEWDVYKAIRKKDYSTPFPYCGMALKRLRKLGWIGELCTP